MTRASRWHRYLRLLGIDVKAEVEEELRFHLDAAREDLVTRGLRPEDASAEAARRFGDLGEVRQICVRIEKERVRRMSWNESLAALRQDLKCAARQLWRSPGFAVTAIASLALGIGVNTAIFTLTDQILFRLLPVERPRELVEFRVSGGHVGSQSGDGVHTFSHPTYLALRSANTVFTDVTGQAIEGAGLSVDGRNELLNVAMVAGNYFELFGVKPYSGRLLKPDDDRVKLGSPVAVLRHDFWRTAFGGNPATVGSKIELNGYPFTVVGIAAPGFDGTDVGWPTNIWIPVTMKPAINPTDSPLEDERYAWFSLFARLKPGVSIGQAEAAMKVVYRQRQEQELAMPYFQRYPQDRERFLKLSFALEAAERGQSGLRNRFERPLVVLQWLVGAVLLIACSNVAGLLLARGAGRQREMAIRMALGAGRGRLVRQLLVESLMLALVSAAVGLAIGGWTTRLLVRLVAADPARVSLTTSPDLRILLFAMGLTLVATLLFGLLPALQASRPAAGTLKESAGSIAGGPAQARLRKAFVACQVGLSILLLIGAGLFARTLGNLRKIDLGFETKNVAVFSVSPVREYDDARKLAVYRSLVETLAATPGVKAAGAGTARLLTGGRSDGPVRLPGVEPKRGDRLQSYFNAITPGYFQALGIPIDAGRDLSWRDWGSGRKYCLVNEALVDEYLGGRNPVGLNMGRGVDAPLEWEVVGVFGNARYDDPRGRIPRQTFFSLDSRIHYAGGVIVYARIEGDPRAVMPQLREQVKNVDGNLLVGRMGTLDDQLNLLLANERVLALLSEAFAALAALLAATGLYGVLSFVVARRSREIGIRMALGARRNDVLRLLLGEMAAVIGSGVAAGVAAAIVCGRFVETQLYGVKPFDARVFLLSVGALAAFSLAAAAAPGWRAARLDPTAALRHE